MHMLSPMEQSPRIGPAWSSVNVKPSSADTGVMVEMRERCSIWYVSAGVNEVSCGHEAHKTREHVEGALVCLSERSEGFPDFTGPIDNNVRP
jgi:hypothetical protein